MLDATQHTSGFQTQALYQSDEVSSRIRPDVVTSFQKMLPDSLIADFAKKSVKIAERVTAHSKASLRVFNFKEVVCDKQTRDLFWCPEILLPLSAYYSATQENVSKTKAMNATIPSYPEVTEAISSPLLDLRRLPKFFSELGSLIRQHLETSGIDTCFLQKPLPVTAKKSEILEDKQDTQFESFTDYLDKHGWVEKKDYSVEKVESVCKFSDPIPCREESLPDIDWLPILRSTFTASAKAANLPFNFNQTPLFIGYVEPIIADEIFKQTMFLDHPASGNLTHGPFTHQIQVLLSASLNSLNKKELDSIITHKQWGAAFDLSPNDNPDGPITLSDKPEQLAMIDYETLINGCYPNTIQTLLIFGLMSSLLVNGLKTPESASDLLYSLDLSALDTTSNKETLHQHILNIRALEYAILGATGNLCDQTADALNTYIKTLSSTTMEALYSLDKTHHWGEFILDEQSKTMTKATVIHYLQNHQPFDVYIQDLSTKTPKLRLITQISEYEENAGYIIYPKGVKPPTNCLSAPVA
ncbi:hypothetical protein [Endozoicomonas numazuensis]|uniref:Uncharacterized protein n=1 Tax=Endozoicomonas numazuensis TaxID=1137799 RepID=A0A081NEH7_9GAMM|nr:hypothetical protein [Endozoicomonas numazuensis]KEQ16850.1 hypothetical protein GZ78_19500 [Endozoicomonas numazuensis]